MSPHENLFWCCIWWTSSHRQHLNNKAQLNYKLERCLHADDSSQLRYDSNNQVLIKSYAISGDCMGVSAENAKQCGRWDSVDGNKCLHCFDNVCNDASLLLRMISNCWYNRYNNTIFPLIDSAFPNVSRSPTCSRESKQITMVICLIPNIKSKRVFQFPANIIFIIITVVRVLFMGSIRFAESSTATSRRKIIYFYARVGVRSGGKQAMPFYLIEWVQMEIMFTFNGSLISSSQENVHSIMHMMYH